MVESETNVNQIPLAKSPVHRLNVLVHGSGYSMKDLGADDSLLGQDVLAHAAIPSGKLYAYDKSTNSEVEVGALDLISSKYGDSIRLVTEDGDLVREVHNMFLIL